MLDSFLRWLNVGIDSRYVAGLRILFGSFMAIEMFRFFTKGWISSYFVQPSFYFSYHGLEFIRPLPENGMYLLFALLLMASIFVLIGLFYRIAILVFTIGFWYSFLIDKTNYLNHLYLFGLLSFLLCFIPASSNVSLDVKYGIEKGKKRLPRWTILVFQIQIALVYIFGGIAKLYPDWINLRIAHLWISELLERHPMFSWVDSTSAANLFSWGGLFFDLLIVPILIFRPTRWLGYLLLIGFHSLNAWHFNIGLFPWLMLIITILLFPPNLETMSFKGQTELSRPRGTVVIMIMLMYVLFQLLLPLRHWIYPGNVHWNEEGHRFSWNMLVRDKICSAAFFVQDPNSKGKYLIDPRVCLTERQLYKMEMKPDLIIQYAHHLKQDALDQGITSPKVFSHIYCSLNGRPPQLMIDSTLDLALVKYGAFDHADWIIPLQE